MASITYPPDCCSHSWSRQVQDRPGMTAMKDPAAMDLICGLGRVKHECMNPPLLWSAPESTNAEKAARWQLRATSRAVSGEHAAMIAACIPTRSCLVMLPSIHKNAIPSKTEQSVIICRTLCHARMAAQGSSGWRVTRGRIILRPRHA